MSVVRPKSASEAIPVVRRNALICREAAEIRTTSNPANIATGWNDGSSGRVYDTMTNMRFWTAPLAIWVASGLLSACGGSMGSSGIGPGVVGSTSAAPSPSQIAPISVQDGAAYLFQPAHAPSGGSAAALTAQQAYDAMLRRGPHLATPIPGSTKALYGNLTEPDTSPPANHMAVWAFREDGGCINTFRGTNARCFRWTFARAADGKDLGVVDQQTHP